MGRPLRCALVIPAPERAVERAFNRVDVWTRTLRALGYRSTADDGAGPWPPDGRVRFRADGRWHLPVTAALTVDDLSGPLPELTIRIGRLAAAQVRLHTAGTGAGTLATVDLRADRAGPGTRGRLLAFGQTLLGIVTVTAHDPQVVVAGAVIDDRRVLAARRTRPPELAGKWEMPGGKVDPGEGERAALARELREELGIEVSVGDLIGPEIDLGDGFVLHSYEAAIRSGRPLPMETDPAHDEVRWLSVEELDDVNWLPGDQPFVHAVRERLTVLTQPGD